jgi:hypothetical protein
MILDDLPKKRVFEVPEHYFDSLTDRIEARVEAEATHPTRVVAFTWTRRRTWLLAAGCALLGGLGWFTLQPKQQGLGEESLQQIDQAQIETYLHQTGYSERDLVDILDEKNNETLPDSTMMQWLEPSEEELMQYLQTSDIENAI